MSMIIILTYLENCTLYSYFCKKRSGSKQNVTFEYVFDVVHFWDLLDGVLYLGAEISLSIGVYAIEWVLLIWWAIAKICKKTTLLKVLDNFYKLSFFPWNHIFSWLLVDFSLRVWSVGCHSQYRSSHLLTFYCRHWIGWKVKTLSHSNADIYWMEGFLAF